MHDSTPCHTPQRIKSFLSNRRIEILPWPGNSSDCIPIKNLWEIVNRCVSTLKPTTKTELIEKLIQVWHCDLKMKDLCLKLIQGMTQRIKSVISAKEGHIKY